MDEICVAKFDVYECRKSDRASALSGAQLNICAAQTPEFPDTIPTIHVSQNKRCAQESARRSNFLLPHRRIIMGHYIAHMDDAKIPNRRQALPRGCHKARNEIER